MNGVTDLDPAPTRRDRLRAATMAEITATARQLLIEQGPEAVSLRAIAREMGMTAPGLYRYYPSREDLLRAVVAEIFRELTAGIHEAIDAAVPLNERVTSWAGDDESATFRRDHMTRKMVAACGEFRRWALGHASEFALLFGVPLPGLDDEGLDVAQQCALEFAGTFYSLFTELWNAIRFPVPAQEEIDPKLRAQLGRLRTNLRADAPDGALLVFLRCWILLYGAVSMEVFGHLKFALDDPAPMFDITLGALAELVGLKYPLRHSGPDIQLLLTPCRHKVPE
jgi:AcrR family transcriptional regulator